MTYSNSSLDDQRRTYVRLIGEIRHALNQALTEEQKARGLTKAGIAKILKKHKSFVTRKLAGTSNMTLETLADLAFALDRPVRISLPARSPTSGSNQTAPLRTSPPLTYTFENRNDNLMGPDSNQGNLFRVDHSISMKAT